MPLTKVNSEQIESSVDLAGAPKNEGTDLGYKIIPQNVRTTSYTIALSDSGKHIYYTGGAGSVITIPTNAAVALPIGTTITIINNGSATVSLQTSATIFFAGTASSGNRTLATKGLATIIKVDTDTWFISGIGLA